MFMDLNDFGYTKPNKRKIDYSWFRHKVNEIDNYNLESNSFNKIIGLDENLNSYDMGVFELAVPDRFISAQITLVKLKNTWVTVYYANDNIMYFFKENRKLIYKLNGSEAISTDIWTADKFYNKKILSVIKSVLN